MSDKSGKAVIAVTLLALVLVAVVPLALLAGVILMFLGHVDGGLALSGGSVLAATIAIAIAGISGLRRLRKVVSGAAQLHDSQYPDAVEPEVSDYPNVVRLDSSEYTEIR